jgi:Na+/H+-dicarboxylate symporter
MAARRTHRLTRQIVIAMLAGIVLGVALNQLGGGRLDAVVRGGRPAACGRLGVRFRAEDDGGAAGVRVAGGAGVTALSDLKALGRIGAKALALYLATTAIAVTIALTLAGFVGPGKASTPARRQASFSGKEAPPLTQVLIDLVPTNPVAAMAEGNMLQIIVFALLFGIAMTMSGRAASTCSTCSATSTR